MGIAKVFPSAQSRGLQDPAVGAQAFGPPACAAELG